MSDNVYLGNPNLKKANTPINFTEEQIVEFIKLEYLIMVELTKREKDWLERWGSSNLVYFKI